MDRLARIGAGWIVGCIIGGLAVIAAGVIATDLVFWFRVLLVGAGFLAILIGVGGVLWDIRSARRGRGESISIDLSIESFRTWVWQQPSSETVVWADVTFRVTNHDQTRSVCVATPKLRAGFAARGLRPLGSVRYTPPKETWTDIAVGPLSRTDPIRCTFVGWWKEGQPVELLVQTPLIGGRTLSAPLRFTSRHIDSKDYTVRIGPNQPGPDMRDIHHLEFMPHLTPTYFGFAQMAVHLVDGRTLVSSGGAFDGGSGWQDVARGFIQFADSSHDIRRPCVVVGAGGKVAGLFMSHTGDATDLDNALRSLP